MIDLKKLKELGLHQSGKKLWIHAEDLVLLIDQIEAAQKDAARYQWLRSQPNDCSAPRIDVTKWTCENDDDVNNGEGLRLDDLDSAIDAVISSKS